jgi:Iron-containing redox enzyme
MNEFLIHRSAYQLKEADPHSWAIPRLEGATKAALLEIQYDEYGSGDPSWIHAELFRATLTSIGLDGRYGAYVDRLPGTTLATVNLVSLFGLHRRWRGALLGHLALFESTSAIPNRAYGNGLRRLGFGEETTRFFDEHVEADSLHQVLAGDLAARFAAREPDLAGDVLFGAMALDELEGRFAASVLGAWTAGRSSLLDPSDDR